MPESPRSTATARRPRTMIAAAIAALVVIVGIAVAPRPPHLSTATSGDARLIERVTASLSDSGGTLDRVSVAVIEGSSVRRAHFGADDATHYEIGSITKTMTASLLQIAVDRGEVRFDTRLGDLLDVGDGATADVTLEQLATHSSGLPRLAMTPAWIFSLVSSLAAASDPYGRSLSGLIDDARATEPGEAIYEYSNFGYALLGQALAAAADTDWTSLVRERIHEPLRMTATSAVTSASQLPADATTGFTASGRRSEAWTMGAHAPAGNVRSTLDDMVRYLTAQLDDSAPGARASDPRVDLGDDGEIGLAWFTPSEAEALPGSVRWHNGGTGGFSSFVAFDRDRDRAVVVLANAANADAVDALGVHLMGAQR